MKVLVTGGNGMLARAVVSEFRCRGHIVVAPPRAEMDVASEAAVEWWVDEHSPDLVVQGAAYTAVDAAEAHTDEAFLVNATATRYVAAACRKSGALLIYPSTDYVFGGCAMRPYGPADAIDPLNAYGRSKAAGERAVADAERFLVVRTSWLYGAGGRNFVDTILGRARTGAALRVVDDQIGRPTWTGSLAQTVADLAEGGAMGIFHATDGGAPVSWYGFAQEVLRAAGLDADIAPVPGSEWPTPAPRPVFSVLDCRATEARIGRALPDWRSTLRRFLAGTRVEEAPPFAVSPS